MVVVLSRLFLEFIVIIVLEVVSQDIATSGAPFTDHIFNIVAETLNELMLDKFLLWNNGLEFRGL